MPKLDYEVTFKQEILREVAADITGDYWRYMRENGISSDDESNIAVQIKHEAFQLKDKIFTECNTLDDLKPIEARLREMGNMLEELNKCKKTTSPNTAKNNLKSLLGRFTPKSQTARP